MRRLAALLTAAGCIATATGCAAGANPAASGQRDDYAYVAEAVGATLPVYARPGGPVITTLANPNVWHDRLALLATARSGDWLKVLLPIRPNGSTGWVPASSVQLTWDPYRLVVDLSAHRLTLLNVGKPVLRTPVAVGSHATPTPRGVFYLTSLLRPPDPAGAYGPYAFGLSGFSPVLKTFAGGPGEIGLHGTDDKASIGHSVTHGCIRVANAVITRLAGQLPLGTPVVVTA
ncbi:MAG TPA: L,D-transpeptidase [Mycobacteriales bacterium]|nr:L,D-transpeptidase [Mycobacteriales bacterium]